MKFFSKPEAPAPDPRELLRNVRMDQQILWTNCLALREVVREKEKSFVFRAANVFADGSFNVENVANQVGVMFAEVQTSIARDFAAAKILLQTLEASEAFKEADAIIRPLLSAIAESDRNKQAKATAALAAAQKLRELKETRLAEAQAAVEADPAVVQAKQELAEAEAAAG